MLPLISLLKAAATDRDNLDANACDPAAFQRIIETGHGPFLHFCSRNNPEIDTTTREYSALRSTHLTARVLTSGLLDATSEILAFASPYTREITLLEGISLCQRQHTEPHLRTMGDIDLLVPSQQSLVLESMLRDVGYQQCSEYPESFFATRHHSMPFFHPIKRVWVELHTAFFPEHLHNVKRQGLYTEKH